MFNEKLPKLKTEVLSFSSKFFLDKGFKWVLPKVLMIETDPLWPDPSGEEMLEPPTIDVYGTKMRLVHSFILHKQLLIGHGIDKLFVISPNVRLEKTKPDGWHLFEFNQLDFEVARGSMYDIIHLLSSYLKGLRDHLHEKGLIDKFEEPYRWFSGAFKSYDYLKIIDEYGSVEEFIRDKSIRKPFFITNIPREFYDYYDERIGKWRNYDLIIPRYGEVSSGGEREWEYEKIIRKMKEGGIDPSKFKTYLEFVKEGLIRPSAGAGIGIERIITVFGGFDDIRFSQFFPRVPMSEVEF